MLTEKQAWQHIAALFKYDEPHFGLCAEVEELIATSRISERLGRKMFDRIDEVQHEYDCRYSPFYWPCNPDGSKERIKFCLAQVARLTKAAHKRKGRKK